MTKHKSKRPATAKPPLFSIEVKIVDNADGRRMIDTIMGRDPVAADNAECEAAAYVGCEFVQQWKAHAREGRSA
jgi:hypothetical protein